MKTISVLYNFSEFPGFRYCADGANSGEEFYHTVLNKEFHAQFKNGDKLRVNLDHINCYASSFLDESFGNLVFDFSIYNVKRHLEIISEQEPYWIKMLIEDTYPKWENKIWDRKPPMVTMKHKPWFRLENYDLKLKVWRKPKKQKNEY